MLIESHWATTAGSVSQAVSWHQEMKPIATQQASRLPSTGTTSSITASEHCSEHPTADNAIESNRSNLVQNDGLENYKSQAKSLAAFQDIENALRKQLYQLFKRHHTEAEAHGKQANRLPSARITAWYDFSSTIMASGDGSLQRVNRLPTNGITAQYDFSSAFMQGERKQANRLHSM